MGVSNQTGMTNAALQTIAAQGASADKIKDLEGQVDGATDEKKLTKIKQEMADENRRLDMIQEILKDNNKAQDKINAALTQI